MKLSMNFLCFVVYNNNYSIVVYGGNISLDFHCFKALNNNLGARLFLHVHFYASSDLLMACRTMQLRFFKLGTVLTYAFNSPVRSIMQCSIPLYFFFRTKFSQTNIVLNLINDYYASVRLVVSLVSEIIKCC